VTLLKRLKDGSAEVCSGGGQLIELLKLREERKRREQGEETRCVSLFLI